MILYWAKITRLYQDFTWCLSHNGMLFSFSICYDVPVSNVFSILFCSSIFFRTKTIGKTKFMRTTYSNECIALN